MAILTKAQLEALNQSSFPDQATEAITPAILRTYNTATIDTLVDSLDTGSFATSAITASSLITASVNLNTITFTKGNGNTFAVTVNTGSGGGGSTDISSLNAFTASQLTINSGLNASTASQQISINLLNSATASLFTSASLGLTTASFSGNTLTFTKGNGTTFGVVIPDVSGSGVPTGTISGSQQITNLGFVSSSITASSLVTASFSGNTLTFTKGDTTTFGVVLPDVSGSTIDTGSFATTGSNTFIGDETFSDSIGNGTTLTPFSGSLVLTVKGGLAFSSSLQNNLLISASADGRSNLTNIIFNTVTQSVVTASVIISGSNNIFQIPTTNTAGFQRRIGSSNLGLGGTLPQFTSSMSNVPVVYNNNVSSNGTPTFRGPISSSTYTFSGNILAGNVNLGDTTESMISASAGINFQGNFFAAGPTFRAGRTQLVAQVGVNNNVFAAGGTYNLASSSIAMNNNSIYGGGINLQNNYYAPSAVAGNQRVEFLNNLVGGQSSQFFISGSNTTTTFDRQIKNNFLGGNFCQVSASANGDNSSLLGTIIYGNNIITYANSPYSAGVYGLGYGSAFLGRNNDLNGTRALTANTIFAVGTGPSQGVRKTGFLIDSGSNTFIEGTLNVSGATSINGAVNITGSLTSSLTEGYVWVGGAGNVSTLVATSSFGGGSVPAGTVSSSAQITAFGFVSSSTAPTGTVSSSAQILGYNIFATTGSNTFNDYQIIKSNLSFQEAAGAGGSDNSQRINSLNQSTLYVSNTSVSSGYNSGSVLQLSVSTGSSGYGSGSAVFQMDAVYAGNTAAMKVGTAVGLGSYVQGFGDNILFAKAQTFPTTPSTTFRVDSTNIDLSGSIRVDTGGSGSAAIVSVNGSLTVNNGLVTSNSIILATTQELNSGNEYPAVVSGKTNGSFTLSHNFAGSLNVGYLIINPIP